MKAFNKTNVATVYEVRWYMNKLERDFEICKIPNPYNSDTITCRTKKLTIAYSHFNTAATKTSIYIGGNVKLIEIQNTGNELVLRDRKRDNK